MTPQGLLGNSLGAPTANSNLYNQVSSMGMAASEAPEVSQEQPQMESLVDKLMKRSGAVFQQLTDLFESYPGSDKEAKILKDAFANWMNASANKVNESEGTSTY